MANAILNRMDSENGHFIYQNQVFTSADLIHHLHSASRKLMDWEKHLLYFLTEWFGPGETIEVKTSGSTGIPKTYHPLKNQLRLSAQSTNRYFQLNQSSQLVHCLPANFIAGKMMIVRALEAGCTLHLLKPDSNPFREIINPADFIAITPHQLNQAIQQKSEINRVKKILVGGERISSSLLESIRHAESKIYASFGMTETLSHIAIQSLNHPYNPYYQALSGVILQQDDRSCLVIQTPWTDNPIRTNDLVEIHNECEFRWLGRMDDVINSGGIKLHPVLMEEKIQKFTKNRICISSTDDETFGEIPVLVIEGDKQSDGEAIQMLQKMNENLDRYERLKGIKYLQHFPETENGKIHRKEIKNRINNNA